MKRILRIAARDFAAVVVTKGFIIGLLVMPVIVAVMVILGPIIFNDDDFQIEGEYAVVDPTGLVFPEMENALDSEAIAQQPLEEFLQNIDEAPEAVRELADAAVAQSLEDTGGTAPNVRVTALPLDIDIETAKTSLDEPSAGLLRVALIVIHDDAVEASGPESGFGTYDLYVRPDLDDRDLDFMYNNIRESIVNARFSAQALDRSTVDSLTRVARQTSITVSQDAEQQTVRGFGIFLPMAFMILMFMGVMTGGQYMLTSTIEEKSSRVVEVLLSAVSPMELMAGKLLGSVGVSLVAMGLYLLMGLALLTSLSMFGLVNPWLIFYLLIFFLIGFFVVGSLMLAVGASVNEMSEAQSLQTPLLLIVMVPLFVWPAISRNPNSLFATVVSFLPPLNSFGMLLRMASTQPPPWWQVWLSIAIGVASVAGAVWIASKVFRIGLLMYGKPPNLKTLIRWVWAA